MEKNNAFKNLASSFEKFGKDAFDIHDQCGTLRKIAEDIANRRDREMALEFTKQIAEFLVANGVTPQIEEYKHEDYADNSFECRYGYAITGLDFTEHDKKFIDEIKQLKCDLDKTHKQLMESEQNAKDNTMRNFDKLPDEPISVVDMLINAKKEYEPGPIQKAFGDGNCMRDKYSDDDLEQIAEHLMVYCKHNREE